MLARLQLLGAPTLITEGEPLFLPLTKPSSLLFYLACRGGWVSRNELAFLYRPDESDAEALKYLRKLVFRARQFPWAEGLEAQDTRLRWQTGSDVQLFLGALEHERFTEALSAYQGPLLQGLNLPDAPGFDAWLELERDTLETKWRSAAAHYAELLAQQGRLAEGGTWLERLLAHDPLDEDTLQRYMQLLHAKGERHQALERYRAFRATLERELGAEPLETTQALADSIQQDSHGPTLAISAPVTQSAAHQRYNLPAHTTRFIGRARELKRLAGYLANPECRLITLLGLGGTGKTRLALESAAQHVAAFPGGVWFVPLAGVAKASLLAPTIASTLGLTLRGSEPQHAQLSDFLRDKRLLLVLDNLEHLSGGALLLETLLAACAELKLLVTSRVALELPGEWLFDLDGLAYPPPESETPLEQFDAVQLFVNRAERLSSTFVATGATLEAIAQLCRKVEGMPLALELAATWTRSLGVPELVERLEQSFDLLATHAPEIPERHRNVQAILEYTWHNLSADEQRVLSKLSLFRAGFTLEAAETVAQAQLGLLLRFINHALVRRNPAGRFELHELVRHYLTEQLTEPAKSQAVRAFYSFFAFSLAQRDKALKQGDEKSILHELTLDIDNLRLAWRLATEHADPSPLAQMAACYYFLLDTKGWYQEGAESFQAALEPLGQSAQPATLGQLLAYTGYFQFRLGHLDEAKAKLEQSLQLTQQASLPAAEGFTHHYLGVLAFLAGNNHGAQASYKQALDHFERAADTWSMSKTHNNLGVVADTLGEYEEALHWYRLSLEASREVHHLRGVASALVNLGVTLENLGRLDEAARHYQESLEVYREVDDVRGEAASLTNLGHLAERNKDYPEARAYYQQSVSLKRKLGDPVITAISLTNLGDLEWTLGHHAAALSTLAEALQLTQSAQATPYTLRVIWSYAKLYAAQRNWPCALLLASFLLRAPESEVWVRQEAEQALSTWCTKAGHNACQAAAQRASEMTLKKLSESLVPAASLPVER